MSFARFDRYVDRHARSFTERLQELCRMPSVAARGTGMRVVAEKVEQMLQRVGAGTRSFKVGSGFPIPEFLTLKNNVYFLSASRNQLRMDYYQRTDLRINKSWTHDKWKFALYGEVVNMSNRTNYLFDSLNSYNTKTGQTSISRDSMLPVIPSAGVLIER